MNDTDLAELVELLDAAITELHRRGAPRARAARLGAAAAALNATIQEATK